MSASLNAQRLAQWVAAANNQVLAGNFNIEGNLNVAYLNVNTSFGICTGGMGSFNCDTPSQFSADVQFGSEVDFNGPVNINGFGFNLSGNIVISGGTWSMESTSCCWNADVTILMNGDMTFGGNLKIPVLATADAPTPNQGVLYFDSTLGKARIGVGGSFQTLTSI